MLNLNEIKVQRKSLWLGNLIIGKIKLKWIGMKKKNYLN